MNADQWMVSVATCITKDSPSLHIPHICTLYNLSIRVYSEFPNAFPETHGPVTDRSFYNTVLFFFLQKQNVNRFFRWLLDKVLFANQLKTGSLSIDVNHLLLLRSRLLIAGILAQY